jgi:hypothetical protein
MISLGNAFPPLPGLAQTEPRPTRTCPHPRPWHRGSLFGDGPRCRLDRNERARFRYLVDAHHRAGKLARAHRDVGHALVKRLSIAGRCDPSQQTLAADVGCSARTVRRANVRMRTLGLLRWQTRLVRADWRAEQTSNAYELVPTAEPFVICCGGQRVRETGLIDKSIHLASAKPASDTDIAAAQAALARRREVAEGRLLARRGGGLLPGQSVRHSAD